MVSFLKVYDCMLISEVKRDNLLSSGPARFQLISAFHPNITARQISNLGPKLFSSFPKSLFTVICRLEVVLANLKNYLPMDIALLPYCNTLSNIYQIFFLSFES
jgi:hypothetical protein